MVLIQSLHHSIPLHVGFLSLTQVCLLVWVEYFVCKVISILDLKCLFFDHEYALLAASLLQKSILLLPSLANEDAILNGKESENLQQAHHHGLQDDQGQD